jgi:Cu-Zn family superoxide dismutase
MPSVRSDAYGNANARFELAEVAIGSGPADILGKGLIMHRDPDDYSTQPTGNAGPRLACAVIRRG